MRKITDVNEVTELLGKYKYEMFNKENNHEGEVTLLDENDIKNILYDMKVSLLGKVVTVEVNDNGQVIVTYPYNICILKSLDEIKK